MGICTADVLSSWLAVSHFPLSLVNTLSMNARWFSAAYNRERRQSCSMLLLPDTEPKKRKWNAFTYFIQTTSNVY